MSAPEDNSRDTDHEHSPARSSILDMGASQNGSEIIELKDISDGGGPPILPNSVAGGRDFVVTAIRLNVRAEASPTSAKVGELLAGEVASEVVSLYGNEVKDWILIKAKNGTLEGWVKKSYLSQKTE
ncbi:SH3 domain-containing protein [Aestuariivirga sp.]|uniref:SH3 domain-containing protein n=1 Tax=Aestuariivirga sp. TaxID=2650926 RepID=UPI0039E27544